MKRKNDDFKFIGIDGFEEIESLVPEKLDHETQKTTEPKAQKLSFHTVTDAWKAASAKRAQQKAAKAAAATAPVKEHTVYKKRAVLAVAASVVAVTLSFATVASALDAPEKSNPPQQPTKATAAFNPSTLDEATAPNLGIGGTEKTENAALYIDGKLIGAVLDGNALKTALDNVLAQAKDGYDDTTTTSFANKVEVKPYSGTDNYKTVEQLMADAQNLFSIQLETDWVYESVKEYESDITYDESQPSSYEVVTQEGVNGSSQVTIRLTYIDGVQTDAVITDEKVITEPVNEKKTVGSADGIPAADTSDDSSSQSSSSGSGTSTGQFIWPLPHTHNITSLMEWRWGRMHNGIDIAGGGDYGMPIIAADGGTVIWSGNDGGGYGNYVMIDHGNGYITVYGHASELACSTGDYVSQGETIAYVGSTGNSTGPHLHFEIRLNGEYQDPLGYVS